MEHQQPLYTTKEEIKQWISTWKDEILSDVFISNGNSGTQCRDIPRLNGTYTIRPDGIVDVDGGVYLHNMHFEQLPIQFGKVTGDFNCVGNQIRTLIGFPSYVGGVLYITRNPQLISLIGGPSEVGGLDIHNNEALISLEYCPYRIKYELTQYNNISLITHEVDTDPTSEYIKHQPTPTSVHTWDIRSSKYLDYLLTCSAPLDSVNWLRKRDYAVYQKLEPELLSLSIQHNLDLGFSDGVKNIAGAALKGNHKLG